MAAFSRMQKYPSVLTSLGTVGEANKKTANSVGTGLEIRGLLQRVSVEISFRTAGIRTAVFQHDANARFFRKGKSQPWIDENFSG
jgi:hypothetical protein